MPWAVGDVDRHKKGLTPAQKKKWVSIANGVLRSCQSSGGSDCEGKAIRIANSKFMLLSEGSPWTVNDLEEHYEFFQIMEGENDIQSLQRSSSRDRPGGSNAGRYKTKGPYCGPSGGAPAGTYPVNTRARARAAVSYARHAPNPSGIKKCVCRHWPSLPSCRKNKGSDTMEQKIPKGALRFVDQGCHAHVELQDAGEGKTKPKMKMTAYTGGIIKGHWYWGDLAIDLEGLKFDQSRYPILEDHNTARKIGHMSKPSIEEGKLTIPEDVVFLDNDAANEFIKNTTTKPPFPYQASIYAKPIAVERLEEGAKAKVNGFDMKGPGSIWRSAIFKEASVCVFGWDSKTSASAFSKEEMEDVDFEEEEVVSIEEKIQLKRRKEVKTIMNLEELKEQYPDLFEEVTQLGIAQAKEEFKKVENSFTVSMKALEEKVEKLSVRNLDLEKKDIERSEKELKARSRDVWMNKLSSSAIPERYFDKIMAHVDHNKFVSEGVFDEAKFVEAVVAEIKDWEDRGITQTVLGSGFSERQVGDQKTGKADNTDVKSTTARLLSHVGQKPKQE